MRRTMLKAALPLLLITAMLAAPSCIFDPKEDPIIPTPDPIVWPDMTSRDDVIKTVVLTYGNRKIGESTAKYNALLHSQYFFGLAPGDVDPGDPPILTRAQDIASTEWLFSDETTVLDLEITPEVGSWYEYFELDGEPCENCYGTERQYFIRAQFGDETTTFQSTPGRAFVVVIVAPDETDASKWVMRAMYDNGNGNLGRE